VSLFPLYLRLTDNNHSSFKQLKIEPIGREVKYSTRLRNSTNRGRLFAGDTNFLSDVQRTLNKMAN